MPGIAHSTAGAPALMKLLAHDVRWRTLEALVRSDRRVHELVGIVGQPFSLVSYHLRKMRDARLVVERRSSADARDVYYAVDFPRLRELYFDAADSLYPALLGDADGARGKERNEVGEEEKEPKEIDVPVLPPARVLFLCTHNSARSQMAEGIMRHLGGNAVEVYSAGSYPSSVHPDAVRVMGSIGIDISGHYSKSMQRYVAEPFDYIITVCDRVREVCPLFPGDPERIHWSFADPAAIEDEKERLQAFHHTALDLMTRVRYVLLLIERERKAHAMTHIE